MALAIERYLTDVIDDDPTDDDERTMPLYHGGLKRVVGLTEILGSLVEPKGGPRE